MTTPSHHDLKIFEDYLALHDPANLKARIARYEAQSRKPRSREQIRKELYRVLMPQRAAGLHYQSRPTRSSKERHCSGRATFPTSMR